jgi:hypothetical protein
MTANLFDAENDPAAQETQIEAKAGIVGGATRAVPDRAPVLLAKAPTDDSYPAVLVRRDVAIPKRILLASASIWRMADRQGGAGISGVRVLYPVLLEMRIRGSFGRP